MKKRNRRLIKLLAQALTETTELHTEAHRQLEEAKALNHDLSKKLAETNASLPLPGAVALPGASLMV